MGATFVRAARHRSPDPRDPRLHITGDVLHLAIWAHDRPGTALIYGTGRWVPLCGGNGRPVEAWVITGPWAERWPGHAHWPVCRRCRRLVDEFAETAAEQTSSHERSTRP